MGCSKFACEREPETEHNWNILTPEVMAVNVVFFSFSMVAQPSTGFPYYISSPSSTLLACLHWLVEPNWPELNSSVQFVGLLLPSNSHAVIWTRLRNVFRYLATGMCHFRFLWNGLCDLHRAEITVIQFRGHSLPVRQSESIMGFFLTSSHFISQFPPTRFPLITAIGMCHFLSVHYLEWHFWPGQQVKT